ncbi:hypothetical protein [Pseudomonas luteola]|uniref:hypothetical protein n=1 Tax=Pseudomonas luteola TaxID=47886 RepID=UPI001238FCB8|nr:hypothetical protein [Pseudomonas luteola]QEU28854.1 hypothetical protein FOB45_14135 [Pseudomonas luteola]
MNEIQDLKKANINLKRECIRLQAIILQMQDEQLLSKLEQCSPAASADNGNANESAESLGNFA